MSIWVAASVAAEHLVEGHRSAQVAGLVRAEDRGHGRRAGTSVHLGRPTLEDGPAEVPEGDREMGGIDPREVPVGVGRAREEAARRLVEGEIRQFGEDLAGSSGRGRRDGRRVPDRSGRAAPPSSRPARGPGARSTCCPAPRRDERKPRVLSARHPVKGKDRILAGRDDGFGSAGERLRVEVGGRRSRSAGGSPRWRTGSAMKPRPLTDANSLPSRYCRTSARWTARSRPMAPFSRRCRHAVSMIRSSPPMRVVVARWIVAEHPRGDHRAREPVRRTAPPLLLHGEDRAAACRRLGHHPAAEDRDRQRLFAQHVTAGEQRRDRDPVVGRRLRRDVERDDRVVGEHLVERGQHGRPTAEERLGVVGASVGGLPRRGRRPRRGRTRGARRRRAPPSPRRWRRPIAPDPTSASGSRLIGLRPRRG